MSTIKNAASFIVAVSLMGFILIAEHAYQQSWSDNVVEPTVTADTSSASATFTGGMETIVMK